MDLDREKDVLSRKAVRAALKAWGDSRALGGHPLAGLAVVDRQRRSAGYGDSPIGSGVALRDVLRLGVEALKPDDGPPDPLDRRWRPYVILSQQYLDGRSPEYVAELMGLARSTYDHEQAAALEGLASRLHEQEARLAASPEDTEATLVAGKAGLPRLFLAPPLPERPLVGRNELLELLKVDLLSENGPPAVVLTGLPGVGKTALALSLAHDTEVIRRFDDGVLWIGLGRTPDLMSSMALWAAPLGLTADETARLDKLEDRAKAIHAAIGMRRLLVVVDDVWQARDGLAFKIGGPNCAHLFTTRMPGVAVDLGDGNVNRVQELGHADGVEILKGLAPAAAEAEPEEMHGLVEIVGGLPLALVLMGRHLRHAVQHGSQHRARAAVESLKQAKVRMTLTRPQTPLDHQPSLAADQPHSLQTIIELSVAGLSEESRRVLTSISTIPAKPNTFSESAAIEVGATTTAVLDELLDTGLVEGRAQGRYALHQVISEYLRSLEPDENAPQRLVAHYVHHVEAHASDHARLDADLQNIVAALGTASDRGLEVELVSGAVAFTPYLEARGLYSLAWTHLERAEVAARRAKDKAKLTEVLAPLGRIAQRRGDYTRAEACFQEALDRVAVDEGSPLLASLLQGLGVTAFSRGDYATAGENYRRALEVARRLGHEDQVTASLANLGTLALARGDASGAEAHFKEGLALARRRGDHGRGGALLLNLGVLAARRGDFEAAEARFREGLELARSEANRPAMCNCLTNLGALFSDRGEREAAKGHIVEALGLAREMGDPARTSQLLANLGALKTSSKEYEEAEADLRKGLSLARAIGQRESLILLLNNLGVLERERGQADESEAAFREALDLAESMGHTRYRCVVLNNWGALHLVQGDLDPAESAYQKSLDAAKAAEIVGPAAESSFGLARVARIRGDLDLARKFAAQSKEGFDSLHHRRSADVTEWLRELA